MRPYALIEAPSTLGLSTEGVEGLPDRLLSLGLAERISANRAGRVDAPRTERRRDPETTILNAKAIAGYSPMLAAAIGGVLNAGEFPVVLGGDCTILLGAMLALRRRGRYGLLFIDGHADFFQAEAEPNGEGASMELAWATGHGPRIVSSFEGFKPLVRSEDVVALGYRNHEDQAEYDSQPLPEDLLVLDLPAIRWLGIEASAERAVEQLVRSELEGFFIHLDADCLDDAIMPAVDFRIPGGLAWDDLAAVLRMALRSGKCVSLEATIYNPRLDENGAAGRGLADVLARALSEAAGSGRA